MPDRFSLFLLDAGTGLPLFSTSDVTGAVRFWAETVVRRSSLLLLMTGVAGVAGRVLVARRRP